MTTREKAKRTHHGRQRAPQRVRPAVPVGKPGRDQFRFFLERGTQPTLSVDDLVETVTWDDSTGTIAGTVGLRAPFSGKKINLQEGHRLRCDWNPGLGRWYPLWRMRIVQPNADLDTGQYVYTTTGELSILITFKDDWVYRKTRKKPRGWRTDEIIRDVCNRVGLKIGSLPKMKKRHLKFIKRATSAYDVIVAVLKLERIEIGTRWIMNGYGGRFNIVPLFRRNRDMLVIADLITAASLQFALIGGATELGVKATVGKGKSKKKVAFTVRSAAAQYRFGRIRKPYKVVARSKAQARQMAKRALAKLATPMLSMTLTQVGIPTVRAGDALRIEIPPDSFGTNINHKVVYVITASHTIDSSGYTMDLEMRFDDPVTLLDIADNRSKKARADAARKRKRTLPKDSKNTKTTTPKPKKAAQRR